MKRFLAVGAMVIALGFGVAVDASAFDVQKLYFEASNSLDINDDFSKSGLDNIEDWTLEARGKIDLFKGVGVDVSAFHNINAGFDNVTLRTGVFYQPIKNLEFSFSSTFAADDFSGFGDDSVVKVSFGQGF